MAKSFEVYKPQLLSRTIWLVAGRVIEGELNVGDMLTTELLLTDVGKPVVLNLVAIETYGRALENLSLGHSGQLIVQVARHEHDAMIEKLISGIWLTANG